MISERLLADPSQNLWVIFEIVSMGAFNKRMNFLFQYNLTIIVVYTFDVLYIMALVVKKSIRSFVFMAFMILALESKSFSSGNFCGPELEKTPEFQKINEMASDALPHVAKILWARSIRLTQDRRGVPKQELAASLDASEYLPLFRDEIELINKKINSSGAHTGLEEDFLSFIRNCISVNFVSYLDVLKFMAMHDAFLARESAYSTQIIEDGIKYFGIVLFYIETREDLFVRYSNSVWNFLASPLWYRKTAKPFDGRRILHIAKHDSDHSKGRFFLAGIPEEWFKEKPPAIDDLFVYMKIHLKAYQSFMSRPYPEVEGLSRETQEDLRELFWTHVDHEHNEIWCSILGFQDPLRSMIAIIRTSVFRPTTNYGDFQRRLRTRLRQDDYGDIYSLRSFARRLVPHDYLESIRNLNERQILATLGDDNSMKDPRARRWVEQTIEDFKQWLGSNGPEDGPDETEWEEDPFAARVRRRGLSRY